MNIFNRNFSSTSFRIPALVSVYLLVMVEIMHPFNANAALPLEVGGKQLPSLAPMLEKVTLSVVNIATTAKVKVRQNPFFNDPFFKRFFDFPEFREQQSQSLGSGVIVDAKNGYILTNHHVVENAQEIQVTLKEGKSIEAKLVGADPETDIAVLRVPTEGLSSISYANSENLKVGDFVVAIGNPFGLGQTVTSGIVSALGRTGLGIEGYENFIQTDASINVGNSGGALVNLRGELVGINTAILAPSGGNVGIGFAIPINMARNIMNQLTEHGSVSRGFLGVATQDLTNELAEAFDIKVSKGAVIVEVQPGSAADKIDLRVGDVITKINNKSVKRSADVRNRIGVLRAGSRINLELIRQQKRIIRHTLLTPREMNVVESGDIFDLLKGAKFADIAENAKTKESIEGVLVSHIEAGSDAWQRGLRKGDIIVVVDNNRIKTVSDLKKVVADSGRFHYIDYVRGNRRLRLLIR